MIPCRSRHCLHLTHCCDENQEFHFEEEPPHLHVQIDLLTVITQTGCGRAVLVYLGVTCGRVVVFAERLTDTLLFGVQISEKKKKYGKIK